MKKIKINSVDIEVTETETTIFGLRSLPQLADFDNDADWLFFTRGCPKEVSSNNFNLVDNVCKDYMTNGILEIGVSRNGDGSFTQALLQNKPDTIPYLGVDLDDKSFLNDDSKSIYTLRENSFNQSAVREYMKTIGMDKISILFIDGWHSVNAVINDWLYTDLLSDNGIVIMHDTNYHPGPAIFKHFIDTNIFRVESYFENEADYGVAIAYRL